jgi:DNA (cytosine-5)-methyltransferase 1
MAAPQAARELHDMRAGEDVILDACHGAGGWAEGLRELGRESLGIELDPDMVATSRAAAHRVIQGDVARIDPRELLDGEECEGLIFSPPCPSFSNGGKRLGRKDLPVIKGLIAQLADGVDNRHTAAVVIHDERSLLTVEPMRWAYLLQPEWIALEQVPPVLPVWEKMAEVLNEHGYYTWTGIVYAERYGVPQTRQRAVLMASRVGPVSEPTPTHRRYYPAKHKLATNPPDAHLPRWVSMAEALDWGMNERPSMSVTGGGTYTGGAEVFGNGARKGMRRELEAGRWTPDKDWVVNYRRSGERIEESTPISAPAPTVTSRYNRLQVKPPDWAENRPATTVQGDARIAGPGHKDGRPGSGYPRQMQNSIRVSVADAGTLQTFPADYPWQGTKTKQYMQVGNAVPPLLAKALLAEVMSASAPTGINLAALGL